MSLANQLFNDKGTNTCALGFRSYVLHEQKKKTWFGYWRDDGFIKSKRRRKDIVEKCPSIRKKWIDTFLNRTTETGYSLLKSITAEDEWLCEAYLETDYSIITQQDFERNVKKIGLYNLMLDIQGGVSVEDSDD